MAEIKKTISSYRIKKKSEYDHIDKEIIESVKKSVGDQKGLVLSIDASHTDYVNGNAREYTGDSFEKRYKTFFNPAPKPYLLNHNDYTRPVGRILDARFIRGQFQYPDKQIAKGLLKIGVFIPEITGDNTTELFRSGIYLDNSIGFERETAKCSICGTDWMKVKKDEDDCEHVPGKVYDNRMCYPIIDVKEFRESSAVFGTPADAYSKIVAMSSTTDKVEPTSYIIERDYISKKNEPNLGFIFDNLNYGKHTFDVNVNIEDKENEEDNEEMNQELVEALKGITSTITDVQNTNKALVDATNKITDKLEKLEVSNPGGTSTEENSDKIKPEDLANALKQIDELKEKLENSVKEIDTLKASVIEKDELIVANTKEVDSYKTKVEDLEKKIQDSKAAIQVNRESGRVSEKNRIF